MSLNAIALNCTLKTKPSDASSTKRILSLIAEELKKDGVETETIQLADRAILPGVKSDEGEGDEWPQIREKILAADILIVGTPIWLGQPSSVAKRALERMDAFLDETDEQDVWCPVDVSQPWQSSETKMELTMFRLSCSRR